MEDLIRRSDAIDAVIEWYGCKPNDIEAFEKIIEAVPSADRPQEWIPCGERLPDENDSVLITWGNIPKWWMHDKRVCVLWHYSEKGPDAHWWKDGTIVAWMPLPKPWEGEEDE